MSGRKAVVLSSGGIDSTTALAIAKAEGYEIYSLTFDYGQRHVAELDAARRVADFFKVNRHLVVALDLRPIGGSALTDHIGVPKGRSTDDMQGDIPVTYVPARNTIFLSFALAWAEVLQAPDIFIGATAVDYSGYPDCRPEYLMAFEHMANLATRVAVEDSLRFRLRAPLLHMKKSDIILAGRELGLDYSLTWSCYDPQPGPFSHLAGKEGRNPAYYEFVPCGRCDSCLLREKGFEEADK